MPKPVLLAIIALLLVIAGVAVFGLTRLGTEQADESILKSYSPSDNDKIPQQGQVSVELMTGWDGSLSIGQRQIPKDQLIRNNDDRVASYQALTFQPGPGKVFEAFPAGQNCATVTYWQVATGPSQSFTKTWCFTAF
jgi:hypothetical protein